MVSSATVTEGQRVTLTCSTTCTLSDRPTFTWFRNSVIYKHTTDRNLHFDPVQGHDKDNYSCAVRENENISSSDVFLSVTCKLMCPYWLFKRLVAYGQHTRTHTL